MSTKATGYETMLEHMLEDLQERSVFPRPEEAQLVFYLAVIEKLSVIEGRIEGMQNHIEMLAQTLDGAIATHRDETGRTIDRVANRMPMAGKGY